MSLRSLTVLVVSMAFGLTVFARTAEAQKGPERVFGGKIMVSDKKYPSYAKSVGAYISQIKKQSKSKFWEDKKNQRWKIHFAAFFKAPLNDIEVVVKLYDVGRGTRTLLASFEQFLDQRGQRALLSNFTLERKHVGVNKRVLMVLEVRGKTVATGRFDLLGEEERYTGKVDFSDEDTKKNDDE
ncbi:MAG: hypothetical protein F9K40_21165 [Kofleriaceae bacterium]|nr:MAG: hypothetical protein F9K40_21165 [Kofleriaceae bacterium]MBZ0236005.1 hypothetical protein [Kofleriaceae bacterium]